MPIRPLVACLALALVSMTLADDAPDAPDAPAPEKAAEVVVHVDSTLAPDLAEWLDKAAELIKAEHPKIAATLASEGFTPPREVRLAADDKLKIPGVTTGNLIRVSADWVRQHPDDVGMVVHELVHVIQRYPRGPGWVTEGIADWYRYYRFEPGSPRARFRLDGARYDRGYQPTAAFFDYVMREHDPELITTLNAAMRRGRYSDELFVQRTGKTPADLWALFVETRRKAG